MYLYSDYVKNLKGVKGSELIDRFREVIEKDKKLKDVFKDVDLTNAEVRSWQCSLPPLINLICEADLGNLNLTLEYGSLVSQHRMDAVLTGFNKSGQVMSLIIELKQWSDIDVTYKQYPSRVKVCGVSEPCLHPIEQTNNYLEHMKMYHSNVVDGDLEIDAIQYLHNMDCNNKWKLFYQNNNRYKNKENKLFCKGEEEALKHYMQSIFKKDDIGASYELLINGTYVYGNDCFQNLEQVLGGEEFINLLDEQIGVADKATEAIKDAVMNHKKLIICISGDPGTGKSVLGMELLRRFYKISSSRKCYYSTPSRNLKAVLKGYCNKSVGNSKYAIENIPLDFLVIDEAHRLAKLNNIMQSAIKKINILVLLQDDNQRILMSEEGTLQNIENEVNRFKENNDIEVDFLKLELNKQRRIANSSNYSVLVNQFLNGEPLPSCKKSDEYIVKVAEHLQHFNHLMARADDINHCKILASYCWPWSEDVNIKDIKIFENNNSYEYAWNPKDETELYNWYLGESRELLYQLGCCYTSQGLQYQYIGLIFWDDMFFDGEKWIFDLNKMYDSSLVGGMVWPHGGDLKYYKIGERKIYLRDEYNRWIVKYDNKELDLDSFFKLKNVDMDKEIKRLLTNIYRILMTRATKGVIIWFKHEETKKYFKRIMGIK